jgi:hypothetical protein
MFIKKHSNFLCETILLFNRSERIVFRHGFRSPSPLAIPPNESFAIYRQTPYRNVLIKIYYTTLNAMK